MNFEQYTYENLLADALANVPDTVDKREGSIIYDALAPACYKLAECYMQLNDVVLETFAATATGDYLAARCEELGVSRRMATQAVKKATFTSEGSTPMKIDIGSRFSTVSDTAPLIYAVSGPFKDSAGEEVAGVYQMTCETPSTLGNDYTGALIPIDYIEGLSTATMSELLIPGEDEETDEALLARYRGIVIYREQDGNVAQYQKWADEFDGVGKYKVFPLWNGANTVKVSIVGADGQPASDTLISAFQTFLDPNSKGLGNGAAPIGAIVTVTTGTAKSINVTAKISLAQGYEATGVTESIQEALKSYFADVTYNKPSISYLQAGATVLAVSGVEELTEITLNGTQGNIEIEDEEIPVLNDLKVTVL